MKFTEAMLPTTRVRVKVVICCVLSTLLLNEYSMVWYDGVRVRVID